jgi:geranyl-CoA carboxylase beta subunit
MPRCHRAAEQAALRAAGRIAGANLLQYRVEAFVNGGKLFYNLARLSAAGMPVVTVVHGSSTAGGAYMPGLSDYVIMVRGRAKAFLAGPPLLKAATGEIATEEELGGAEMHTSVSGLGEYLAEDDADACAWRASDGPPATGTARPGRAARAAQAAALRGRRTAGVMPLDTAQPVDMREVIARIVDDSDFLEFGPTTAPPPSAATRRIEGQAIGIITNNGPIDPAGANKATHFIQAAARRARRCCTCRTPPATWSARPTSRPA